LSLSFLITVNLPNFWPVKSLYLLIQTILP
jgi:hypothetical protein